MPYPISHVDGIDVDILAELKARGIRTTDAFLLACRDAKSRRQLAEDIGIDPKVLLAWANMCDRMRIKGLGREYAILLQKVGVTTVRELRFRNPSQLAHRMAEANKKRKLVRVLPSERAVERWVEEARKLELLISY